MNYQEEWPDLSHWKSVMEFTVEEAALLMAAYDPFDVGTIEQTKHMKLSRWKEAMTMAKSLVAAMRQGVISPAACYYVTEDDYNREIYTIKMNATDRSNEISIQHTIITRASLLAWIESENVPVARPIHQHPSPALEQSPPQQPDSAPPNVEPAPLALPYHGHNSEGLNHVKDAIKQLWSTYDPDQPDTAPTKKEVIEYLQLRGASKNLAQAVDLILRPEKLRTRGLKNQKPSTREEQ